MIACACFKSACISELDGGVAFNELGNELGNV